MCVYQRSLVVEHPIRSAECFHLGVTRILLVVFVEREDESLYVGCFIRINECHAEILGEERSGVFIDLPLVARYGSSHGVESSVGKDGAMLREGQESKRKDRAK